MEKLLAMPLLVSLLAAGACLLVLAFWGLAVVVNDLLSIARKFLTATLAARRRADLPGQTEPSVGEQVASHVTSLHKRRVTQIHNLTIRLRPEEKAAIEGQARGKTFTAKA